MKSFTRLSMAMGVTVVLTACENPRALALGGVALDALEAGGALTPAQAQVLRLGGRLLLTGEADAKGVLPEVPPASVRGPRVRKQDAISEMQVPAKRGVRTVSREDAGNSTRDACAP